MAVSGSPGLLCPPSLAEKTRVERQGESSRSRAGEIPPHPPVPTATVPLTHEPPPGQTLGPAIPGLEESAGAAVSPAVLSQTLRPRASGSLALSPSLPIYETRTRHWPELSEARDRDTSGEGPTARLLPLSPVLALPSVPPSPWEAARGPGARSLPLRGPQALPPPVLSGLGAGQGCLARAPGLQRP